MDYNFLQDNGYTLDDVQVPNFSGEHTIKNYITEIVTTKLS